MDANNRPNPLAPTTHEPQRPVSAMSALRALAAQPLPPDGVGDGILADLRGTRLAARQLSASIPNRRTRRAIMKRALREKRRAAR